jgi:hypothetical protein
MPAASLIRFYPNSVCDRIHTVTTSRPFLAKDEVVMLESSCGGQMPIYEYWCESCGRVVSSYRQISLRPTTLSSLWQQRAERVFSTFSVQKTYRDVYEDILSDRELTQGMMRDDPRALAEWNKRMSGGEKSPRV